jgi:tRNA A-37 threonylcarbamoyl transferase component Bud32
MKTFTKFNVTVNEYEIYKYTQNLNIVNIPSIVYYDPDLQIMTTQLIDDLNIADTWSDNAQEVPDNQYEQIVHTVCSLRNNGIEYPDITGYNFIYHDEIMWIVDFEHAKLTTKISDPFINLFCKWKISDKKQWNPRFR